MLSLYGVPPPAVRGHDQLAAWLLVAFLFLLMALAA